MDQSPDLPLRLAEEHDIPAIQELIAWTRAREPQNYVVAQTEAALRGMIQRRGLVVGVVDGKVRAVMRLTVTGDEESVGVVLRSIPAAFKPANDKVEAIVWTLDDRGAHPTPQPQVDPRCCLQNLDLLAPERRVLYGGTTVLAPELRGTKQSHRLYQFSGAMAGRALIRHCGGDWLATPLRHIYWTGFVAVGGRRLAVRRLTLEMVRGTLLELHCAAGLPMPSSTTVEAAYWPPPPVAEPGQPPCECIVLHWQVPASYRPTARL